VRNTVDGGNHDDLARKLAVEGIVLVKNEDKILPLNKAGLAGEKTKIGIFGEDGFANPRGPNACEDRSCNEYTLGSGWGSGASDFPYLVAPFDALNATLDHTKFTLTSYPKQAAKEAGPIATAQDICLVFVTSDSGEGYLSWNKVDGDRNDLGIQKHGDELVNKVASHCNRTIVILHAVGPTNLESWIDKTNVKAVLLAHLPGQESGNALVDVLFGHVTPSGHLPYTVAKSEDDYGPTSKIMKMPNHIVPQQNFTEGLYIDYRYFDKHHIEPRYAFGYGLSYTTFELSSLEVKSLGAQGTTPAQRPTNTIQPPNLDTTLPDPSTATWPEHFRKLKNYIYPYIEGAYQIPSTGPPAYPPGIDPSSNPHPLSEAGGGQGGNPDLYTPILEVQATLNNTGDVAGAAVVQLYISYPEHVTGLDGHTVDMPVKVLRGFEKIEIGPKDGGEVVKFEVTRKDLSYWDVKVQNWVMPRGKYTVKVGFSSRDLPLEGKIDPFVNGEA
jgi:beta-glucosidase